MNSLLSKSRHLLRRYIFVFKNHRSIRQIGKDVSIYGRVRCVGRNLYIGDSVSINEGVFLNAAGALKIGSYSRISPFVQIHTGELNINQSYKERGHVVQSVYVKDGVWLCAGVIVLPGVTIGEGSVIAAGSVVTKDVPKFELWGGVPAQKIKSLS